MDNGQLRGGDVIAERREVGGYRAMLQFLRVNLQQESSEQGGQETLSVS